jgi:hypothetical protein
MEVGIAIAPIKEHWGQEQKYSGMMQTDGWNC